MTAMASHKLQEAVFAALSGDEELQVCLNGIYDEAPVAATYPYLTMGETNHQPSDLKDRDGAQISFGLLLWSNEASQMQVKELMAKVDETLSGKALDLVSYDMISLRLQNASVVRQWTEEGSLYRGRLTYSATVYERASI